jgi:CSLREA domain-containing protein
MRKTSIHTHSRWFAIALLVTFAAIATTATPAHAAATIAVTTFDDEWNGDGDCSLREAIIAANTDTAVDACPAGSGDDTILLGAGTYVVSKTGSDDTAGGGDLDIWDTLTITGVGPAQTVVDATGLPDAVFHVTIGANATLSGFTILAGNAGIYNRAALTISVVHIADAMFWGVRSDADHAHELITLSVIDSVISGSGEAAIFMEVHSFFRGTANGRSDAVIANSLITGNRQGVRVAAIDGFAHADIVNSTIEGNLTGPSVEVWGANRGSSSALVLSSTIANNRRGTEVTALASSGTALLQIGNSILSNNVDGTTPANCVGTTDPSHLTQSLGGNVNSDSTCPAIFTASGDTQATDPVLAALADNGGPTSTMALLPGSPALDRVPLASCIDHTGAPLTIDQRHDARPNGAACDSGAFEGQGAPAPVVLALTLAQNVGVGDHTDLLRGLLLSLTESIGVADGTRVLPPVIIITSEAIGVADLVRLDPGLVIALRKAVGITDSTSVVPPLIIVTGNAIAIIDLTGVVPPLIIDLSEAVGMRDTIQTLRGLILWLGDLIGVRDITTAGMPDADGDGIHDAINGTVQGSTFVSQSNTVSNNFHDRFVGGTTFGRIENRAGLALVVEPIYGVGVSITGDSGTPGPASLWLCNDASRTYVGVGQQVQAKCGSVTLTVLTGPITADLFADDGSTAIVVLDDDESMTFDPETNTVTAPEGQGDILLIVGSEEIIVPAGETVVATTSPRAVLEGALASVASHADASNKVRNAATALERALNDRLWTDSWHLDPKNGQRVFDACKDAVEQIQDAIQERGRGQLDEAATTDLTDASADLVRLVRLVARRAILDVEGAVALDESRQEKVDKAIASALATLADGDAASEAGNFGDAIAHYRKAWKDGQSALRELLKGAPSVEAVLEQRRREDNGGSAPGDDEPDGDDDTQDDDDDSSPSTPDGQRRGKR